ncbi:hypothetical protein [Pelosinus sp. sgz500959]|uniref:hypothetical protein n=1 Tax=Pelosinus sp. sgz500959 TaxID=3242472 RepID=UPI00366BB989
MKESTFPLSHQLAIYQRLKEKQSKLAQMYLGAIMTLQHHDNPERLAQVAHSLRELMEKASSFLEVAVVKHGIKVAEIITPLCRNWAKTAYSSACYKDGKWSGTIDNKLGEALIKVDNFTINWLDDKKNKKADEIGPLLTKLCGVEYPLPQVLNDINWKEWHNLNIYFQNVAHHGQVKEDDFNKKLYELEQFLLNRLAPCSVEDFAIIDSIIQEGEKVG